MNRRNKTCLTDTRSQQHLSLSPVKPNFKSLRMKFVHTQAFFIEDRFYVTHQTPGFHRSSGR